MSDPILPDAEKITKMDWPPGLAKFSGERRVEFVRTVQLNAIRAFCDEVEKRAEQAMMADAMLSHGEAWWKASIRLRRELGI